MASRDQQTLINEITNEFSKNVSPDAKFTIYTIRNLIESNARVEGSIDELHKSINNSSIQNEKLQRRIYFLTIVAVILTLVQAAAVLVELFNKS
jgi:arginine utilization protein RocB